jgi:RNA polymerase subunit RPABC4/transcription elongation factor Spt4
MLSHTRKMKRRVAAAAILALLAFLACLMGLRVSIAMREAALSPQMDLEPLAQRLRQSVLPDATGPFISEAKRGVVVYMAEAAYQRTLDAIVAERPDIVAAVVVGPDERIIAAAPGRERLVGRVIMPVVPPNQSPSPPGFGGFAGPPAGSPYATPGGEYGSGGPPGYPSGPYRSGGPPSYGPGGPPGYSTGAYGSGGPPGGPSTVYEGPPGGPSTPDMPSFPDPIKGHLGVLLYQAHSGGSPALQAALLSDTLFIAHNEAVCQFYVLPRPNEAVYWFADKYLEPACVIGTLVFFPVYWLMLPWWVYLDARWRTGKAVPLALFVLLTNFLGWLTYLVIRPEGNQMCPVCVTLLEPSFRVCPHCGWSRAVRCRQCSRALRSDWRFCPYCEAPRPDAAQVENTLQ